jgi:hypothetical protein
MEEIVNLPLCRSNFNGRIHQSGRSDDLLDNNPGCPLKFIIGRGRRNMYDLIYTCFELSEVKWGKRK